MIIAIDGPAAAGKGTLARRLAVHYSLALLDTGLLYRAVGYKVLSAGQDPEDAERATEVAEALVPGDLKGPNLRNDEVAQAASKVSAVPGVRAALLAFQQDFAHTPPDGPDGAMKGAVLDGRDIGTVVCPDADAKLFVTASVEVRAERRLKELLDRNVAAIHARVLQDMKERDARDSGRGVAPLVPAQDALQIDTSDLDADAVFAAAVEFIDQQNGS
ncbi:MAG: (d)CMP kinase [Rhodospirillales bacterium]|jgi:CMP/dCMP kinase|nr:(d)CMP kinase [Rhodospirillaceae bacterium]MBT6221728.1 (d)CMP kinase [Rhodospirillaceae bacterium]MBT6363137.1 (d)CMP kinase [Rhodospirillaceae bacterium]MBT6961603.1 (d)CMP kinase [Rhodospirillaceae bacterium]MBT8003660.1 (d)CMP kinase [Rhodospirillales bacterium]